MPGCGSAVLLCQDVAVLCCSARMWQYCVVVPVCDSIVLLWQCCIKLLYQDVAVLCCCARMWQYYVVVPGCGSIVL